MNEEREKLPNENMNLPKQIGIINDFEDLLSIEQRQQLDSIINKFDRETKNQIVIVTIENVSPYENLKDFTTDLGNYWGVGQVDENNGLIITISEKMKKIWIGTGLGTEEILTNEVVQNIIDSEIIPQFKKGEYYEGIKFGLLECINKLE